MAGSWQRWGAALLASSSWPEGHGACLDVQLVNRQSQVHHHACLAAKACSNPWASELPRTFRWPRCGSRES